MRCHNNGTGDVIIIKPYDGMILDEQGETVTEFSLSSQVILDEVRAGGRIPLIIGRGLTLRAREALGLGASEFFNAKGTCRVRQRLHTCPEDKESLRH